MAFKPFKNHWYMDLPNGGSIIARPERMEELAFYYACDDHDIDWTRGPVLDTTLDPGSSGCLDPLDRMVVEGLCRSEITGRSARHIVFHLYWEYIVKTNHEWLLDIAPEYHAELVSSGAVW